MISNRGDEPRQTDFIKNFRYQRINVIGTSGSGKTTFSRNLAEILGFPCYEMDAVFWKPGWQGSPDAEFFQKIQTITSGEKWILDGNYTRTTPIKWKRVQLVIWLDFSFIRTLCRVTKRAVSRSITRRELWPGTGNRESLTKAFLSRNSIILWAITTYHRNRKKYKKMIASMEYRHIEFLRLDSPKSAADFLKALGNWTLKIQK